MKKRLRSPAVLLTVFAMVLVVAGIGYAHWTSVTRIEGNINTGNMHIGWDAWGTNDDGDPFNDPSGNDNGNTGAWDSGNGTTRDPGMWDDPGWRYDKNVAGCWIDGGEDTLNVHIDSAYPSYHCHVFASVFNHGSVPAIPGPTTLDAYKGYHECLLYEDEELTMGPLPVSHDESVDRHFVDFNENGVVDGGDYYIDYTEFGIFDEFGNPMWEDCFFVGDPMVAMETGHPGEVEFSDGDDVVEGILCDPAFQIDPGHGIPVSGWIHMEQGAEQNASYRIVMETEWVNWNEWLAVYGDICTTP